eukprot:CAMPEP_0181288496 /NCGR_PEP_ID=MMETSP1101-20121128/362_1 /TAXON_ID=46948 /ORGANISM="Rhodomonas abbreviata, Strain Caron Lab Isolate" /LENGTH=339 /DNA_ID=CAMNT_0023392619 /DNA_START=362 /DNA_END=1377 /DNA_ORIENTATION=+
MTDEEPSWNIRDALWGEDPDRPIVSEGTHLRIDKSAEEQPVSGELLSPPRAVERESSGLRATFNLVSRTSHTADGIVLPGATPPSPSHLPNCDSWLVSQADEILPDDSSSPHARGVATGNTDTLSSALGAARLLHEDSEESWLRTIRFHSDTSATKNQKAEATRSDSGYLDGGLRLPKEVIRKLSIEHTRERVSRRGDCLDTNMRQLRDFQLRTNPGNDWLQLPTTLAGMMFRRSFRGLMLLLVMFGILRTALLTNAAFISYAGLEFTELQIRFLNIDAYRLDAIPNVTSFGVTESGCPFFGDSTVEVTNHTLTTIYPRPVMVDGWYLRLGNVKSGEGR